MKRWIARGVLRIAGWKAGGNPPVAPKYVLIAAPHTSNWDFVWVLAFSWALGVPIHWMGKHAMFRWPFGGIMRLLGGIPVRRDRRQNLVQQLADLFAKTDSLVLVIPSEGTRGWVPNWRSGFYHVARAARVPVVLGFLDYRRKVGGFGPTVPITGDVRADMDRIRAFYDPAWGRYPESSGRIHLVEEDQPATTVA